jgi:hypothetical protein
MTKALVRKVAGCGVMAIGHGRRVRVQQDAPSFRGVTLVRWLVRV